MIKQFATYAIIGAVCFCVGYQFRSKDTVLDNLHTSAQITSEILCLEQDITSPSLESIVSKSSRPPPVISELKKQVITAYVNEQTEEQVFEKVASVFGEASISNHIDDVKKFSLRLVSELEDDETEISEDSAAFILFSTKRAFPPVPENNFIVSPKQKIYSHIDVQGALGSAKTKFFVRWKHIESNEVLLFTHKNILQNSDRNWVSYQPHTRWKDGNYQVTFYQFTSELEKLASESYTLRVED